MATGVLPFHGSTSGAVSHSILGDVPTSPVRLNPHLPPKLEDLIAKTLEKDPELRYQHAAEICSDLKRIKREIESGQTAVASMASPATAVVENRRRWQIVLAITAAAVAVAAGVFLYLPRSSALTEKDTVVLADLDNKTGEPRIR